jgi:hypothetical protein
MNISRTALAASLMLGVVGIVRPAFAAEHLTPVRFAADDDVFIPALTESLV